MAINRLVEIISSGIPREKAHDYDNTCISTIYEGFREVIGNLIAPLVGMTISIRLNERQLHIKI